MSEAMFDVVAVEIDSNTVLWVEGPKTERNAEAIVGMAIMRQGVEDRFFTLTPTGIFKAGDKYHREGEPA